MNNFIYILCGVSLSGSLLALLIRLWDWIFINKIQVERLYFFLKLSLVIFFLPGWLVTWFCVKIYSYEFYQSGLNEIQQFYLYGDLENLSMNYIIPVHMPVLNIIFYVWFCGAIVSIVIINLYKRHRMNKIIKSCVCVENKITLDILEKIVMLYKIETKATLYQCSYIRSPFIYGIFSPKIVIPKVEFSAEELEIIFRHELMHYKNKDIIFRSLIGFIQGINWFNPLMLYFSNLFYAYGEFACDEKVSNQLTKVQRGIYARLLHRLSERADDIFYKAEFAKDDEKFLRRRIYIIMKGTIIKKTAASSILALSLIIIGGTSVSFGASLGAAHVYNEILDVHMNKNTKEERYIQTEYEEYTSTNSKVDADVSIVIVPSGKGSNTIDVRIPAGKTGNTNPFSATSGKGIKVIVSGDSASDTFIAGMIDSSGNRRYVKSENGSVDYTFIVSQTGSYTVYFENTGDEELHLIGTIYVNY